MRWPRDRPDVADGRKRQRAAMIVLGFDTSTPVDRRRAAPGGRTPPRRRATTLPPARTPGTRRGCSRWPPTCSREAGVGWSEIDRIAVGVGPGHVHRPARRRGHRARPGAVAVGGARRRLEPAGAGRCAALASGASSGGRAACRARGDRRAPRRGVRGRVRGRRRRRAAGAGSPARAGAAGARERPRRRPGCGSAGAGGGWRWATGRCAFARSSSPAGVALRRRTPRRCTWSSARGDLRAGRAARRRRASTSSCPTTGGARTRS